MDNVKRLNVGKTVEIVAADDSEIGCVRFRNSLLDAQESALKVNAEGWK